MPTHDRFLTPEEVVQRYRDERGRLTITASTLETWRRIWIANGREGRDEGPGPRWVRLSSSDYGPVRYRLSDLRAWERRQAVHVARGR